MLELASVLFPSLATYRALHNSLMLWAQKIPKMASHSRWPPNPLPRLLGLLSPQDSYQPVFPGDKVILPCRRGQWEKEGDR